MSSDDFRTIWLKPDDPGVVQVIDQRQLPHELCVLDLTHWSDGVEAITDMAVRGAPLIGATAAWSLYLAAFHSEFPAEEVKRAATALIESRPTAVNLRWAIERIQRLPTHFDDIDLVDAIREDAVAICNEDIDICLGIGRAGLPLIRSIAEAKGGDSVNILTHCNAGALATINWGTATAPIYLAAQQGIDVHVWVDETRPRNQGALTAWELGSHGIPHTYVVDNAGGHLMQRGLVDLCLVGTDRTARNGDVCNKIGTYLKALAAHDNGVPFYVALPSPTIDWTAEDGVAEIPIEERAGREISHVWGQSADGIDEVQVTPAGSGVGNPAFDVTPNRLVTGLITERGVSPASAEGLAAMFPDLSETARSA